MRTKFSDEDYFPPSGARPSKPGLELEDICLFPIVHFPRKKNFNLGTLLKLAGPAVSASALSGIGGIGSLIGGSMLRHADAQPHFVFRKPRAGGKHAMIFVNGFQSQGNYDTGDWETAIKRKFARSTWYHLDWDACRDPRELLTVKGSIDAMTGSWRPSIADWHSAMSAAETAGKLLARAIVSTPAWRFTLAGHSLGARVIHFALKELARQRRKRIENAYLLGGAVGGSKKDDDCWNLAASAVKGKIYNCFSDKDDVLGWAYRGANAMMSDPVGFSGIHLQHRQIFDFDCSALVSGHSEWKVQFAEILRQLDEY